MRSKEKFRGCLIGGAAGDALGYAVELMEDADIFRNTVRTGSQSMICIKEQRKSPTIHR